MNTYPRYSVKPFSLWTEKTNAGGTETSQPCAICGKQVKLDNKNAVWVTVVDGGDRWAANDQEANEDCDPGFMGGWPVGSDCHKKYLVK